MRGPIRIAVCATYFLDAMYVLIIFFLCSEEDADTTCLHKIKFPPYNRAEIYSGIRF